MDLNDRIIWVNKSQLEIKDTLSTNEGRLEERLNKLKAEFGDQIFELKDIMGANEINTQDGDKLMRLEEEVNRLSKKVDELQEQAAAADRLKTDNFLKQVQKDVKTIYDDFANFKQK